MEDDRQYLLQAQKNFAFISGGQADWLDLLRPIACTFNGFRKRSSGEEDAIGPVTRWFRTNTFYRKPLVGSRIQCYGTELLQFFPKLQNSVAFLLGPYSFVRLVEDGFYHDPGTLAFDYAAALEKNIVELKKNGCVFLLLLEPALGYDISKKEFEKPDWFLEALSEIRSAPTGVHFPLADAKSVLPWVEESPVEVVGVDAIYTEPSDIRTSKDVILGVVDGGRASVESKSTVVKQVQRFLEKAQFSGRYYLAPNDRLFDVPFEIALQKIRTLAEVKIE